MYMAKDSDRPAHPENAAPQSVPRQPEPEAMDLPEEAAAYAHTDFAQVNQAFVARLTELAEGIDVDSCLDLGTGPADIPIRLIRLRPNWHVVALDASLPMLGFARHAINQAALADSIELVQANARETKLADEMFDVIFSNSILHHINDTDGFWREVRRVGRPGALVFLRDLMRPRNCEDAWRTVQQYAEGESELLQRAFYSSLLAAYTPDEVRAQLDSAGLATLIVEIASDRHMDVYGRLS